MSTRAGKWGFVLALTTAVAAVTSSCHRPSAAVAPAPAPAVPATTAPASAVPAAAASGTPAAVPVQGKVSMVVTEEGFVPNRIAAQVGKPVTLAITRKTDRTCAREILFKDQPGKTDLPLDREVQVTYTPKTAGTVAFGCAMGMMIGGALEVR